MLQNSERQGTQSWMPTRYNSNQNQFSSQSRYISNLTRQDISEYITNFPFIYHIYKKNKPHDQWRLLDQFMKVPSETDGPGFIYGFMNEEQNSLLQVPYWIKMGRTKQNPPQTRIFQWQRDDNIRITEIFTVRTLYQKKLEALVHILFCYARRNRVINGHERKQWFYFQQITLTAAAVNILNHIMNTIHTTKIQNKPNSYLNRNLKQISQKLVECNNQITDILGSCNKFVIESFTRDLGIQLGSKNEEIKKQMRDCNGGIQDIIKKIVSTVIGKQLKAVLDGFKIVENVTGKFNDMVKQFKLETQNNLREVYDKTKVNFNAPTAQPPKKQINLKPQGKSQQKSRTKSQQSKSKQKQKVEKLEKVPKQKIKDKSATKTSENAQKQKRKSGTVKNQNQKSKQKQKTIENKLQSKNQVGKLTKMKQEQERVDLYEREERITDISTINDIEEERMINYLSISDKNVEKVEETVSISVYNKEGSVTRKQQISASYFRENNQTLKKYKQNSGNSLLIQKPRSPKKQKPPVSTQQISQVTIQRISQILTNLNFGSYLPGHQFIIYSQTFYFDCPQINLQYSFLVMSKKVIIENKLKLIKGNKFKGFLKIFCFEIKDSEKLQIDTNCEKYVGIYQVLGIDDIFPVDKYHQTQNKKDVGIEKAGRKLLELFKS